MAVSREMTTIESNVFSQILSGTCEEPIPAHRIRGRFGMSKRQLENIVESLRVNFRIPIVAKKFNPNGYYIPRNEEERNEGLAPLQATNSDGTEKPIHYPVYRLGRLLEK